MAKARSSKKTKAKAKRSPGRPTLFNDRLVESILEFAKTGATDSEIAEKFGIAEATLYLWKGKYPTFSEALRGAKSVADELVEMSMFRMAVGYTQPDIHFSAYEGMVTETPYIKHVGPNFQAAKAWLAARQPKVWSDTSRHELTGKDGKDLEGPKVVITLPSNGREAQ